MPKNHISNPYIGIIEMFESENQKSSNHNRKIEIGIIEAEIRIEATQLTRRIVTALVSMSTISYHIRFPGVSRVQLLKLQNSCHLYYNHYSCPLIDTGGINLDLNATSKRRYIGPLCRSGKAIKGFP